MTAAVTAMRMRRLTRLLTESAPACAIASLARAAYQPCTPAPPAKARATMLARTDISAARRWNLSRIADYLGAELLPALDELSRHQKVPSSDCKMETTDTLPVTERSVALLAPRQPKCPRSAGGSKRPSYACQYESTVSWRYSRSSCQGSQPEIVTIGANVQ